MSAGSEHQALSSSWAGAHAHDLGLLEVHHILGAFDPSLRGGLELEPFLDGPVPSVGTGQHVGQGPVDQASQEQCEAAGRSAWSPADGSASSRPDSSDEQAACEGQAVEGTRKPLSPRRKASKPPP